MARRMVYRYAKPEAVTPDADSTLRNIEGAWSIMVTVSGNVNFHLRDATTVVLPILAGSSFELGSDMVHILAASTTASGIFKFTQ